MISRHTVILQSKIKIFYLSNEPPLLQHACTYHLFIIMVLMAMTLLFDLLDTIGHIYILGTFEILMMIDSYFDNLI